jgi:hypothetical protein
MLMPPKRKKGGAFAAGECDICHKAKHLLYIRRMENGKLDKNS